MSEAQKLGVPTKVDVRSIQDWPLQDRLGDELLFVVVEQGGRNRYTVVGVDGSMNVWEVKTREDFNDLLRREGVTIRNAEEAELAAQLFLRTTRVYYLLDYGWELGVNVVRVPDDITFRDSRDRQRLLDTVTLAPPRIAPVDQGYEYRLFGWQRIGAGAVNRFRVLVDKSGVKAFVIEHVLGSVGTWTPM